MVQNRSVVWSILILCILYMDYIGFFFFNQFFSNVFSLKPIFFSSATDCFKILLISLFSLLVLDITDYSSCVVLNLRYVSMYFCL